MGTRSTLSRFLTELRRRRTFRTAGLYVIGAWLLIQVADVVFTTWDLPAVALRALIAASVLGFPVAVLFGWFFDVTEKGIVRTAPASPLDSEETLVLQRRDYVLLAALAVILGVVVTGGVSRLVTTPVATVSDAYEAPVATIAATNSIAVLPFANASSNPENDYFCEGISDELLHTLSTVDGLRVTGRTSSFAFGGGDHSIPHIAGVLGVRYLLQGSVRQDGDRLRIIASLVDYEGTQQWSQVFEQRLENVFDIQAEIARIVVATVSPRISSLPDLAYEPNLEAYTAYIVGKEKLRRRVLGAHLELERAVTLDPKFALAHAEYAIALLISEKNRSGAKAAIDTALELQPGLPRALAALGLYFQNDQSEGADFRASEDALQQALAAEPNMADAMSWMVGTLRGMQRSSEAEALSLRLLQIDPLHGANTTNVARELAAKGDFEAFEKLLAPFVDLPAPPTYPVVELRNYYLRTGQLTKVDALEKRFVMTGDHLYFGLAKNYAMLGLPEVSDYWLTQSKLDFPQSPWVASGTYDSLPDFWRGRYAEALLALERKMVAKPEVVAMLAPSINFYMGTLQSLSGKHEDAVETLVTLDGSSRSVSQFFGSEAYISLAWALKNLGETEKAVETLQTFENLVAGSQSDADIADADTLYALALASVVAENPSEALERLQLAIDAGWRGFYIESQNPIWASLQNNPRLEQQLEFVQRDIDRQRSELDTQESPQAFQQRFEDARQAR